MFPAFGQSGWSEVTHADLIYSCLISLDTYIFRRVNPPVDSIILILLSCILWDVATVRFDLKLKRAYTRNVVWIPFNWLASISRKWCLTIKNDVIKMSKASPTWFKSPLEKGVKPTSFTVTVQCSLM